MKVKKWNVAGMKNSSAHSTDIPAAIFYNLLYSLDNLPIVQKLQTKHGVAHRLCGKTRATLIHGNMSLQNNGLSALLKQPAIDGLTLNP